ncbi:amino acid adenylation domain-containing protein [Kitasatospora sp. NPDC101176]|uniref:non-ribosomal peptide synthetase n=1 Tax=Kitasatospora sp. NPDC101176 TaxID=3364099 RepID=UPI003814B876
MTAPDPLDRLRALPHDRRTAFLRRLRQERAQYDLHPLTAAQRRMWLHDRLWPGSPMCQVHFRFELAGPLDEAALVEAFDRVLARHQALRTVFLEIDGEPWQWVLPRAPEGARLRLGADHEGGPFDLAAAPPVRATLVQDGAERRVLHLELHHIVCDGWSMGLLFDDLSRAYGGALPGPAPRHVDVAAESEAEELVEFWRRHLDGAPAAIGLPTDLPRPPVLDESGAELSFDWPAELAHGTAGLAAEVAGTPYMVLLAAWQAVLSRYGGPDLVVATPVAGRTTLAAEGAVGLFANTVALRAAVPGTLTFRGLLERVRGTTLAALAHQELPFDSLVDRLRVERDPGSTPLAQVMFAMESGWAERLRLPGVTVHGVELPTGTAMFDLTLTLTPGPDGIAGRLEYRTSLFTAATAARIVGHVRTLLTAALADPDRRIEDLPLLTAQERRTVDAWTGTRPPVAPWRPVTELIAAVPAERIAVVHGGRPGPGTPGGDGPGREGTDGHGTGDRLNGTCERLSYGELRARADRIAAAVRAAGAVDETPVGVCLRPGPDAVAAFLGILAAGAVYVPLDPDLPAERLRYLVEDSGTALVLAEPGTFALLPEGPTVLTPGPESGPGRDGARDPQPAAPRPAVTLRPDQAAYLIYTSGSTGRPKGVVSTHRGLTNLADAIRDLLAIGPDDRVLAFHAPGFDAAVSDLLTALCAGAELHLAPRAERMPGPDLARTLRERRITMVDVPPIALQAMDPAELPDLRVLTVGGEACPVDVAEAWRAGRAFHNTYGPTEASVMVTGGRYRGGPTVPIGRPLTGTRIHVLDDALRPVPIGVVGELYLGGAGVGRGYLGRPGLTAAAFLPDPFVGGGARLYRSGDLARWRDDGTLDILGRRDRQVKIRGNRVEPGEAEARLRECPGVARCAVVVREDEPGRRRLVGYLVPDGAGAPGADALRETLLRSLPDYLVPEAFVVVPDLPTTPNGKLDHRALPVPTTARPRLGTPYRAPRGATETAVAAVWRAVLGLDRVGADDNFFDLGGNSMLVVKVHTGLREALGVRLAAVDLFRYPSVARLARFLDADGGTGRDTAAPARPAAAATATTAGTATTTAPGRRALAARTRRLHAGEGES